MRILLTVALLTLSAPVLARTLFPAEARTLWRKQLLRATSLHAWHDEFRLRPVAFPTTVPCSYVDTTGHDYTVIRDKTLRTWLAETVGKHDPSAERFCERGDRDVITLSTGDDPVDVRVQFDPARLRLDAWDQRGNWETYNLDESEGTALLALLRAAMPNDMRLSQVAPCPPHMPRGSEFRPWPARHLSAYPQVTTQVVPRVPVAVEDSVVVHTLVDAWGFPLEFRIMRSVPDLDAHAIEALTHWHFKPANYNGYRKAAWVTIAVPFRPAARD